MTEEQVAFNFNARYHKLGSLTPSTKQLWFVLHGYGQLAQYFLRKFQALEAHQICLIAPEGLSRFYLEEMSPTGRKNNRVGATWMTRENREMDIQNYIAYLNVVYQHEIRGYQGPITVLGFSQGAATASRWALQGGLRIDRLILWAGILPPDMDFSLASQTGASKEIHFVHGTQDPFITDARFDEMKTLAARISATPTITTFEGGHDVDENTLLKFI